MAVAFAEPVASETPIRSSMSLIFMWCGWLGSLRKLTQPMTRTIPLAHDSGLPRISGDGRLRARMPASFRHKVAYSSSRNSRQKASVMPTISSCARRAASEVVGLAPFALPFDLHAWRLGVSRSPVDS